MKKLLVTIFIHGTLPPVAFLRMPLLKNFFWCPRGLHPLDELSQDAHLVSLGKLLCEDTELFDSRFFYLFGWSGRLRVTERRKAAAQLAGHISALTKKHAQRNETLSFRIITHSHGGNVALHLAEFLHEDSLIEQLLLLACPVQQETAPCISSSLFKKIYSVHSHLDVIQRIDPQGIHSFLHSVHTNGLEFTVKHLGSLGPLFSARHFAAHPRLTQVHVTYQTRELLHIEFILQDYIRSLPAFIRFIDNLPTKEQEQEILYIIPSPEKMI